jgi:phage gp36-like protein
MAYATIADITAIHGARTLQIVGDRNSDGVIDEAAVNLALASASAEIDSYLASRYSVPIASPDQMVKGYCVDIAVYRLAYGDLERTEEMRIRYDDAIKWLKEVAKGNAQIIGGTTGTGVGEGTDDGLNEITGGKHAGFFQARSALSPRPYAGANIVYLGRMSDWRRRMQK